MGKVYPRAAAMAEIIIIITIIEMVVKSYETSAKTTAAPDE